jgi:spore coat protein CotH
MMQFKNSVLLYRDCRLRGVAICAVILLSFFSTAAPGMRASADDLTADLLLDPDRLTDIVIELPPNDWRELCKQTRDVRQAFSDPLADPFTYFKGSISIDGVKIDNVGIRKKGFIGSLDAHWPSLKVKFDEYHEQHPVAGIDVLTLNNNKQDPSLVSQFLTYHLFNKAGLHAPRVSFARVTVNGKYLGIYSNVESIGKPFLKRRFGNDSGNLYEGTLADFHPRAIDRLEAKNKKSDSDRGDLMRLAELLAKEKIDLQQIEQLVDTGSFIRFWAVESLIGFWDGYSNNQNNYWLYDNAENGKFYFMPWGADGAFMGMHGPFGFWPSGPQSVYAESMLAHRLYHADGGAERYRQAMRELLENVWNEEELLKMIDRIENLAGDHLHDRQTGAPGAMNGVRQFIRSRRETITIELKHWPMRVAPHPRKPMYTVEIGTAKGSFATQWSDEPAKNPIESGRAEVQLVLDGETVTFKQVGATAQLAQIPQFPLGFGPPRGRPPGGGPARSARQNEPPQSPPSPDAQSPVTPNSRSRSAPGDSPGRPSFGGGPFGDFQPPVTLVLVGIRESDEKKLTMTLTVDPTIFASSAGKTIAVQGSLTEGEDAGNFFMPFGGRVLDGKLTLAKVGMEAGATIEGEFDLKVAETHGGFMERMGPQRPAGDVSPRVPTRGRDGR